MSSLLLNFDLPPVDPSTSSMTDDVKPAVLSVAQFRAQLERQMSDIENHLIFELRACEGKQSAVAARARLEGFYAMKGEVVAGYAEARQASAWQPIESAPKEAVLLYRPGMNPRDRVSIRRVSDWCGESCCPSAKPTHWMPIPVLEDDAHER